MLIMADPAITKGGLYAGTFASYTIIDANLRALLSDHYWTSDADGQTPADSFTYFFPDSVDDYPEDYQDQEGLDVFIEANEHQEAASIIGFNQITWYTGVAFELSETSDAAMRIAGAGSLPGND
eukprot:gene16676-21286_t